MTFCKIMQAYYYGRITLQIRFSIASSNSYGTENLAFYQNVKATIEDFLATVSPEMQDILYRKYYKHEPMQASYNIVAPVQAITAACQQLKRRIDDIPQPQRLKH